MDMGSYITFSGTADGGDNWVKLTEGAATYIPDYGKEIIIQYNFKPWHYSGTVYPNSPKLNSITVTSYGIKGGGIPKSGTKKEHSDDVSWMENDIPYPPSYSSWQTYSDPKLKFEDGDIGYDFWIVFEYSDSSDYELWNNDFGSGDDNMAGWSSGSNDTLILTSDRLTWNGGAGEVITKTLNISDSGSDVDNSYNFYFQVYDGEDPAPYFYRD